jgi:ribosomal subunit interface protein
LRSLETAARDGPPFDPKEACMQVPQEISARLIELTPDLEADLRRRAAKLERFFDRVTSCRIAVERSSNHHQAGGPYRVRLDVTVPGSELVANKEGEDLKAVIRDAFQAAERQVEELADRRRAHVKGPTPAPDGEQSSEGPQASLSTQEA